MKRRSFLRLLSAASILGKTYPSATSPETSYWSMFGRDKKNSSYVSESKIDAPVRTEWSHRTGNSVLSSPSVVDDTVYVGSWDGKMYALDAVDGDVVWDFKTENEVPETYSSYSYAGRVGSSPCIVDNKIIFGSWDGNIYAVDKEDGEEIWRFETSSIVRSSPVPSNETVYIGDWTGTMNALSLENGELLWKYETGRDHVYSTPCLNEEALYFGAMDSNRRGEPVGGDLHAVEKMTGEPIWRFKTTRGVGSSPSLHDGVVYFGSFDSNIHAIKAETGEEKWSYETDGMIASSPAVDGERLYIGSWDNRLYALDIETGEKEWSYETNDRLYATNVTATEGAVYFGSNDGKMRAVKPESGELLWDFETGDRVRSGAAVVDGTAYFGSWDGNVYAIGEENEGAGMVDKDQKEILNQTKKFDKTLARVMNVVEHLFG